MADADIAEHLGCGADQHAILDLGVAVLFFLAGAAQSHRMQHRQVVANHGGFPEHDGMNVVDHDALAELCSRGKVDASVL